MTRQAQTAPTAGKAVIQTGEVLEIALDKLKASPRNVRRVSHTAQDIEARAASIRYKGLLQPLVVEPEVKEGGDPSGYYLVTIGEGRRQALRLLAKRKLLSKREPVRCVVDTLNDPGEISLDENTSRRDMHPADQFEAWKDLAERKGYSAEEIAARSGVSPHVVRQRLRMGAVAPALLDIYREGGLTLEQVMAFAVSPDPERQMQVYAQLAPHQRQTYAIRRAMTEAKVPADDPRARFVGIDAYVAAGGALLVDLFTENGEGWLEDVALLDRLVAEKLQAEAVTLREAEGWKWTAAFLAYPHDHGCGRIWERPLPRTPEEEAQRAALYAERDGLIERYPDLADLPEAAEARLAEIDGELDALADTYGFDPQEKVRAGAFVVLGYDGEARIERGYVRPEDEPQAEVETAADGMNPEPDEGDGTGEDGEDDEPGEIEEPLGEANAPISPRIRADLTAHRSTALRYALAQDPDLALVALTHALLLRVFRGVGGYASCLDVRLGSRHLAADGDGIEDSAAARANAERHEAWARQMPDDPEAYWDFVVGLDADSRMGLMAHCVSLSLDAVRGWDNRPMAWKHADRLASALDLDMSDWWSPTAERYLGAVTKGQIVDAVTEGVSPEAAARLTGLRKTEMIEAAQPQLVAARWLPTCLRTPGRPLPWAQPSGEARATALGGGDGAGAPGSAGPPQAAQVRNEAA
ncbi:ParB family chromosome partitioning protein [Caulobacter rhizosphaerae]|uniref:ParB family chromosome partitioning protein n=1 Tax=Caulobacter rhizosphaerae TaxID=2010972 RepID=A0ABU1MVS0_9CAUL|nr:ParB N-terminal domain-containing protein [Caulobacter rhizosphaerae]MDR6530290.1 ParB family chromosome partitioning protein [Caulobacter rhizosphaerae]